jgi:hypothetical protein
MAHVHAHKISQLQGDKLLVEIDGKSQVFTLVHLVDVGLEEHRLQMVLRKKGEPIIAEDVTQEILDKFEPTKGNEAKLARWKLTL